MDMIRIVSATRLSEEAFRKTAALGLSLTRLGFDRRIVADIAFNNTRGLPEVYNAAIAAAAAGDSLVFMHDDVWIDDYFLADRVQAGLAAAEVIGVAGNRRRLPRQPGWAFAALEGGRLFKDEARVMSGLIGHGRQPFGRVSVFGHAPAACELLDGVFLAARKSVLTDADVRFDPRFDFHFYDMDFCRQARAQGLRLSTWPVCLTHQSGGGFGDAAWLANYHRYLAKWPD